MDLLEHLDMIREVKEEEEEEEEERNFTPPCIVSL